MQIHRGLDAYPADAPASVVALGVFDGIHLGHRAILSRAVARARAGGLRALACTFDPHPQEILRPAAAPAPLTTLAERLELIAREGLDGAVVLAFTPALAALEAETFVSDVLVRRLGAWAVVVGVSHTFGRGARGNPALLADLGPRLGFETEVVPPLTLDGVTVSSSAIRAALERADLERAARLLGRPYHVQGRIVAGAGRGRSLGFPTANLVPERALLVPAGVYACRARLGAARHGAVVNIGIRPTFGEGPLAVEAHLVDFAGDLYDETMVLDFVRHLRAERKFPGPDALREQIARDVAAARAAL